MSQSSKHAINNNTRRDNGNATISCLGALFFQQLPLKSRDHLNLENVHESARMYVRG